MSAGLHTLTVESYDFDVPDTAILLSPNLTEWMRSPSRRRRVLSSHADLRGRAQNEENQSFNQQLSQWASSYREGCAEEQGRCKVRAHTMMVRGKGIMCGKVIQWLLGDVRTPTSRHRCPIQKRPFSRLPCAPDLGHLRVHEDRACEFGSLPCTFSIRHRWRLRPHSSSRRAGFVYMTNSPHFGYTRTAQKGSYGRFRVHRG